MHAFDKDTEFIRKSDGVNNVTVSDQWSINHIPNGGYTMALLTRAMIGDDNALVSCIATANYIERCDPKPGQIFMETIGETKNIIRKQARLVQDGKERVRAMGTFIKNTGSLPQRYEKEPENVAPPGQCLKVPSMGGGYTLFDRVDMRLDPGCAGWTTGTLTDRSVQKGWIRFKESREIDVPAITFFGDSFPPCIFTSHGMVAWVPTIEYSVNVRQLPKPGWLRVIFTTRFISSGLVEEDGEIWDEDNNLIAISRQIAKYHPLVN